MDINSGSIYMILLAIWSIGGLTLFVLKSNNHDVRDVHEDEPEVLNRVKSTEQDSISVQRQYSHSKTESAIKTAYSIEDADLATEHFAVMLMGLRLCIKERNDSEAFVILTEYYQLARKHKLMSKEALDEYWELLTAQKAKKTKYTALYGPNLVEKTWSEKQVPMLDHILRLQPNGH